MERSLRHSPLFQGMLVLQNTPGGRPQAAGRTGTMERDEQGLAKFDLTLTVAETGPGLRLGLEYSRDLFDGVTIERLLYAYERLLESIVAAPGRRVWEAPGLGEAEQHQLRAEWNDTVCAEPGGELCLHQLVERQVARTPEAVAVVLDQERWSYAELNREADRLARRLRRRGVGPEVRVGLLTERCLEMVAAMLGVLKAGGAYVPLDPSYPAERLHFMLRDAGV